ncbi:MAG: hypothetical protein JWP78_4025 [Mucilaginibacter sp.]|nr:hypothetical protein [Mucilaginibacter sp.]
MRVENFVLVFTLSGLAISNSSAQNLSPDSLLYSKAATQVIDYFNQAIADQSEIYNGAQYELYPPANKGTFYFRDKNYCIPALIRYNDTWYKDIPVLYDIYNDAMISISGNELYMLRPGKISDVYLLDHHFIYVDREPPGNRMPGFYDLLYQGKSQVLVKLTKKIDESKTTEIIYEDITDIYVKKGDKYFGVNSKGSFMDIFKDKKKELNQYLKDNKINYNKDKEGTVAKLAGYYDQISK